MEAEITLLKERPNCKYCENYKPRTVKFIPYSPPPYIDYLRERL